MTSRSLDRWRTIRRRELDEIEAAHARVGGPVRGRRYTTQQINRAYTVLLSSQFQGFCRDLHSEVADHLANAITHSALRDLLRVRLTEGRKLDSANPNPGNLGSDFGRFGLAFWDVVKKADKRNDARRRRLEELNVWRNAIAHHDFDPARLGGATELRVAKVRGWRSARDALVRSFDQGLGRCVKDVVGAPPW